MTDTISAAIREMVREEIRTALEQFAATLPEVAPPASLPAAKWLGTADAARYLGLEPKTLYNLGSLGRGPAFRKMGRLNRYHVDDLDRFVTENLSDGRMHTSGR